MQIASQQSNINLSVGPGFSRELYKASNFKKALFQCGSLMILLFTVSSLFIYTVIYFPESKDFLVQKVRDTFLNGVMNTSFDRDIDSTRTFNDANLSYFSDIELAKLGILPLPKNFEVQEIYKGIRFVRSQKKSFSPLQLDFLKMFIDITPQKLLTPGPTAIVTYDRGEIKQGVNLSQKTAAFASGSYIFFNDESFNPVYPLADTSIDAVYYTFVHELTHVAQFNDILYKLDKKTIDESYNMGLTWIDLVLHSNLIKDFASLTGWEINSIGGRIQYKLTNPDLTKTSTYGKSQVHEDMAESVAAVVTTNTKSFSQSRIEWVQRFLNEDLVSISKHKFPFPRNMEQVTANNLQFDESKENAMKIKYGYTDRQIFVSQEINSINQIEAFIRTELNTRGWKGSFTRSTDKDNVIRFKGDFKGLYRDMYIEIYSYDEAIGYIIKPQGTLMIVISGYILR